MRKDHGEATATVSHATARGVVGEVETILGCRGGAIDGEIDLIGFAIVAIDAIVHDGAAPLLSAILVHHEEVEKVGVGVIADKQSKTVACHSNAHRDAARVGQSNGAHEDKCIGVLAHLGLIGPALDDVGHKETAREGSKRRGERSKVVSGLAEEGAVGYVDRRDGGGVRDEAASVTAPRMSRPDLPTFVSKGSVEPIGITSAHDKLQPKNTPCRTADSKHERHSIRIERE